MRRFIAKGLALAFAAVLLLPSMASAQQPPEPPEGMVCAAYDSSAPEGQQFINCVPKEGDAAGRAPNAHPAAGVDALSGTQDLDGGTLSGTRLRAAPADAPDGLDQTTLYSQLDFASNISLISLQPFALGAADFEVPLGQAWQIEEVFAPGVFGFFDSGVNVRLWEAAPNGGPGTLICEHLNVQSYTLDIADDITVTLPSPCLVVGAPGNRYYVSVQLIETFAFGWFWTMRTQQSFGPGYWQDNFFGTPCTGGFFPLPSCGAGFGPDWLFSVSGEQITDVPIIIADLEIEDARFDDPTLELPSFCVGDIVNATLTLQNFGNVAGDADVSLGFPAGLSGVPGSCSAPDLAGTCTVSDSSLNLSGSVPASATIEITFQMVGTANINNLQVQTVSGQLTYTDPDGEPGLTSPQAISADAIAECPVTVNPNSQLGRQVHLPILNFQGQEEACDTWIEVQNIGFENAKAVLVTWSAPGFCPPQCAGPLKVECTGLLKPGSTWNFLGAQVPTGAKSGILFKFSARQLREIGVDLGDDDIVADAMCETLFFGVVGDCDDYRRFKKAYNEGSDFGGIPQDVAQGDGSLAVDVLRTCPADTTLGVDVTSKYNGVAGNHLGVFDPVFGSFSFYMPLVYADKAGFNSIMYIQNGGLECSSVEIWFKAQDDCLRARICEVFNLAPGETYQFDASDCVGPDWQGTAWVRTSQPTAAVVDIIGRDVLMTYVGEPGEINYTMDPEGAFFTPGNQVAYGPLIYSEYQGWDSGVQVQNLSSTVAAKVKVYFLDRSGDIITTLVDWVCPRGSQTFFLPVIHSLPGNWVGSVRVESQEWWSPGDPVVLPPNIVSIATLIKYNDAARTETTEAIAYNLLPEHKAYDWQIGGGLGGTESGVALVAIPSLLKDLDATGVTSEISIANVVPKPGFTDFAVFIYDQNGLMDYVCQKLNEKQVEYIDLQTWGYVNPGFKGSALISATFWEHDVFSPQGDFQRNAVGLAAVAVERSGTRLGEDVPGDEAAGARGIPFRTFFNDVEDNYQFAYMGPTTAVCVGTPGIEPRPDPYSCQTRMFEIGCAGSPDCPQPTFNGQVITSVIDVSQDELPLGCVIDDVDVRLAIEHGNDGDITATLLSPEDARNGNPPVTLFSGICGAEDNIFTILDDAAPQSIGAVCPPIDFLRYDTQTPGLLRQYEGQSPYGEWTLGVGDSAPTAVEGQLLHWSLMFRLVTADEFDPR